MKKILFSCMVSMCVAFCNGCSSKQVNSSAQTTTDTTTTTVVQTTTVSENGSETTDFNTEPADATTSVEQVVTKEQKDYALSILSATPFWSAKRYSVGELINSTFLTYSTDVSIIEHKEVETVGYDTFRVTIDGEYYKDTAAKRDVKVSSGRIRFVVFIQYSQGEVYSSKASLSVEDEDLRDRSVYNAMQAIAFGR